jgi:hypothetical protein
LKTWKTAKIRGSLILQELKTSKISVPQILDVGKSAKISGPLKKVCSALGIGTGMHSVFGQNYGQTFFDDR